MPFPIEIVTTDPDNVSFLKRAFASLNKIQAEFTFDMAPQRLLEKAYVYSLPIYHTGDVKKWLEDYKAEAGGSRPYIILVVNAQLSSQTKPSRLFGSHWAEEGLAVFTTDSFHQFVYDKIRFCRYYLVRYALSFLNPQIKSHPDTRDCMFDGKNYKKDLKYSYDSGRLCNECGDSVERDHTIPAQADHPFRAKLTT